MMAIENINFSKEVSASNLTEEIINMRDSFWNDWEVPFPGSTEKGKVASYLIMFGPLLVFGSQAIYAHWAFKKSKRPISKFYSTLITWNIIAMILVTGSTCLNGLLQGYSRGYDPSEYPDPARGIWGLTVACYALIHSVNNCCRVIYDAYGLRSAIYFIPIAIIMQFWQVFALSFGFSPYLGCICIAAIDYVEHVVAFLYWMFQVVMKDAEDVDKKRACFGIGGVLLHMTSIVPQMIYMITVPAEDQTTQQLCGIYTLTIVMMSGSQFFWTKMALSTPPSGEKIFFEAIKGELDETIPI